MIHFLQGDSLAERTLKTKFKTQCAQHIARLLLTISDEKAKKFFLPFFEEK